MVALIVYAVGEEQHEKIPGLNRAAARAIKEVSERAGPEQARWGVSVSAVGDRDEACDLTKAIIAAIETSGGATPIDLSGLMRVSEEELSRQPDAATGWAYWLLDVTVTEDGSLVLLEANGSNAAGNTIVNGGMARVNHIVRKITETRPDRLRGTVAVLPHGKRFHHIPEFFARAIQLIAGLREAKIGAQFIPPGSSPRDDCINVVVGDIPTLASDLYCNGQIKYQSAPVSFIQNGNILPELVRQGKCEKIESLDLAVFHEGYGVLIANDKGLQQDLCAGTGFLPLRWREAYSGSEFVSEVERMLETCSLVAIKPSIGSQGIGVEFVGRGEFVLAKVHAQMAALHSSYGSNADLTAYPLRAFEWVKAEPISHYANDPQGKHLWDLRVEVLVSPEEICAIPVIARVCPAAYRADHPYNPAAIKSNLSGREPSTANLITPIELWQRLEFDYRERVLEASVSWAMKAAAEANSIGGGPAG